MEAQRGRPRKDRPEEGQSRAETRRISLEDSQGFGKLSVNGIDADDDYYYHVVNDKNNRVYQLQQRGYEIVESDGKIVMGESNPKEVGSAVTATCDRRDGTKAVLMRIRKEWKTEDDAYRQRKIDESEELLFRSEEGQEGRYGKIKQD